MPVDMSLANIVGYILTTFEIHREQLKRERKVKANIFTKKACQDTADMHVARRVVKQPYESN